MKKKVTILMSIIALGFGINANAQAVSEGNIMFDVYYGYPNFGKVFTSTLNNIDEIQISGIGPMGARVEYMLADKFGVGVDFIYNSFNATGTIDSLAADGVTVVETYKITTFMQRFRPLIRMNYHFVANEQLDAYFGVGVGANVRRFGVRTDYPGSNVPAISGALIPVSMRIALGMRYFFTDNIGANLELGLGGPFLSGGLSVKF